MAKLVWDAAGQKFYETGVAKGVLYLTNETGAYNKGVVWNGLTGITESPAGADVTDLYADDIKYASLQAAETFGATIEAYTCPDEFFECDGSIEVAKGVTIGQQERKTFGLAYQTQVKNDTNANGYKIHLVYGAKASPSERAYTTVNDSPDAISLSWEMTTTPVNVTDHKATALLTINSLKADATKLAQLEAILYGSESAEPRLPLPDEVITILGTGSVEG